MVQEAKSAFFLINDIGDVSDGLEEKIDSFLVILIAKVEKCPIVGEWELVLSGVTDLLVAVIVVLGQWEVHGLVECEQFHISFFLKKFVGLLFLVSKFDNESN